MTDTPLSRVSAAAPPRTTRELPPVFTLAQAIAAGWTRARLRTACRNRQVVAVGRGCYATYETARTLLSSREGRLQLTAMVAVAMSHRPVWASHQSALVLHDLPAGRRTPERATVTADDSHGVVHRRNGYDLWPASLPPHHRDCIRGIPTVTAARAVIDTCRHADLGDGLIVGDAALHLGATRIADIEEALACCAGWPGIRKARRAAQHFDGARQTPLESLSYAAFIGLGLPLPKCQVTLVDTWGDPRGTVDFYWAEQRVIGEADGDVKYRTDLPGAAPANIRLLAEKRRQTGLEPDHVVARWGWREVMGSPEAFRRQILDAFARAARLFG